MAGENGWRSRKQSAMQRRLPVEEIKQMFPGDKRAAMVGAVNELEAYEEADLGPIPSPSRAACDKILENMKLRASGSECRQINMNQVPHAAIQKLWKCLRDET